MNKLRALCAAVTILLGLASILAPQTARAQATALPPGKQCFQATTGISGMVGTLGALTAGSGGTNGTYVAISLTGGSGSGVTANVIVSGGAVTQVVILNPGVNYVVGDVLSATSGSIGGVTGFSVPVASISINSSLSGGAVGMYVPGTLTSSPTWKDAGQTTLNSNPIQLDANGCALIFGTGSYRQIVYDSLANEVWDQVVSVAPVNPFWVGLASGTTNALTVNDASFSAVSGQSIQFTAAHSSTSSITLAALGSSSPSPISVVKNGASGPSATVGGDIVAGNTYTVIYNATLGDFVLLNSASSSGGGSNIIFSPAAYGADPTNTNDNTVPLTNWFKDCLTAGGNGNICVIPQGHYKFTQNVLLDLSQNIGGGFSVQCAGQNSTLLDFSGTVGTHLTIASSVAEGVFYGTWNNCGVQANNPGGPALQLGQSNLTDAINGAIFNGMWVTNLASSSPASSATQVNQVVNSVFTELVSNAGCGGSTTAFGACSNSSAGDALQLNAAAIDTFVAGSFSSAGNGVHITNGFNFSNVFTSSDIEVTFNGIKCDSAFGGQNSFVNPQLVWLFTGGGFGYVDACAVGNNNELRSPNAVDTATLESGTVQGGLIIKSIKYSISPPVSLPVSGTTYQNTTNRVVLVTVYNGTVTTACFGPTAGTCITGASQSLFPIVLNPGDKIDITFPSGVCSVGWIWNNMF